MLFFVLLASGFQLSYGLVQEQSPVGTFNLRQNCRSLHSENKYKAFCNGSQHFKTNNLTLYSRSVSRITEIELYSFENINIISKTSSDWEHLEKITIRNCNKVTFHFQSSMRLNILEIFSVDEVMVESDQFDYSINSKSILLSNVGKLNLTYSSDANLTASVLSFNNVKDMNFYGKLQFSGELFTISQSNIDLTEHATLFLKFSSITVEESTKLYIQESGQLDISTNNFLIQESYIYMDGRISVTGYEFSGHRKVMKLLNNSIYGMKRDHVHIYGDGNEIYFIENGIYNSDLSDIMDLLVETDGVTFTKNRFGCNICAARKLLQAKYLQLIGEHNFCDVTCTLTLTRYKTLLDQGTICHKSESQVDDKTLCSARSEQTQIGIGPEYLWWIVIICSLVLLPILIYFYCKRYSPRFRSVPGGKRKVPIQLQNGQRNHKVSGRAFSNEVYSQCDNDSGNIYETVDSP